MEKSTGNQLARTFGKTVLVLLLAAGFVSAHQVSAATGIRDAGKVIWQNDDSGDSDDEKDAPAVPPQTVTGGY